MPASGLIAPTLMLVAVRASAPVCGKPLSSGTTICTQPWPQSSLFGLNGCPRLSASRSAMREQSRLSIAETKTIASGEVDEVDRPAAAVSAAGQRRRR